MVSFDTIPHAALMERLRDCLPDDSVLPLVAQWLAVPAQVGLTTKPRAIGVPQGAPLAPLLANLYLDDFDERIRDASQGYVRYADDFLILCASYDAAERALERVSELLQEEQLALNFAKTRVTSFAAGFRFLGVQFEGTRQWACDPEAAKWVLPRNLQPAPGIPAELCADIDIPPRRSGNGMGATAGGLDANVTAELPPLMRTLHLCENGAYLHRRGGRVIVSREDQDLLELPLEKLDQVCVVNEGAVSFGVLREFLDRRVSFVLLGKGDAPVGWLENLTGTNVVLHRAQFKHVDEPAFCLAAARAMVHGKIANSRVVLRRYGRNRPQFDAGVDASLAVLGRKAAQAPNLDVLRGYEGAAARGYYGAMGQLLAPKWAFNGRSRRPPRDPVNVLLSYGYAVLFQNVLTVVVRHGLNPHLGALHAVGQGHAALASDLMEEFRPLVVDAVVLRLMLNGDFDENDFEMGGSEFPCRLRDRARRAYIKALESKLDSPLQHPFTHRDIDFRRALAGQAGLWADHVMGKARSYRPFVLH